VLTGGSVAVGADGWVGAMPGVGDPGMGSTISGVTLGEGVLLGTNDGVRSTERPGSSLAEGVGGVGAPHSPGVEFLAQAVNITVMMAIWVRRWNLFMGRRDYTSSK
jgi:hypothetical protein